KRHGNGTNAVHQSTRMPAEQIVVEIGEAADEGRFAIDDITETLAGVGIEEPLLRSGATNESHLSRRARHARPENLDTPKPEAAVRRSRSFFQLGIRQRQPARAP